MNNPDWEFVKGHPSDNVINAEKNERVLGDFDQDGSMELMNVNGPSHTEGGKDVNIPANSFVFSDTKDLKIKDPAILATFGMPQKKGGYTPADIAKKYDLNKYKSVLDNPNADDYAQKTAQLMTDSYLEKLNKLALVQEKMKGQMGMPNSAQSQPMKFGGAPTFQNGGSDYIPYSAPAARAQGYSDSAPQTTEDYQKWANMHGAGLKVDNKWGNATSSWNNPDIPNLPPLETLPLKPSGMWQPDNPDYGMTGPPDADYLHNGIVPAPVQDNVQDKGYTDNSTSAGKNGSRGFRMNPNFYGNLQNLLEMGQVHKFKPWEPVPQAVIPQTVFMDPTRATAAQQETARSGSEADAMSGNSQAARANGLARQGIAGTQAADTIGKYHNENVGIANNANSEAAKITNDLYQRQASRISELNKAGFLADRDYQREMSRLQAEYVDRMQKQHDVQVKTAWLNKTSPYFNIDPVDQMPDFKPGEAKANFLNRVYGIGAGQMSNDDHRNIVQRAKQIQNDFGVSPEVAMKRAYLESDERRKVTYDAQGRVQHYTESESEDRGDSGPGYMHRKFGGTTYTSPLLEMGGAVKSNKTAKLRSFIRG